jgi:hypothetical protein
VALSICFLFGTWFSTLTNGVIVLGLHGLAFLGGWLEQMSGFTEGSRLATVGILASLVSGVAPRGVSDGISAGWLAAAIRHLHGCFHP